MVFRHYFECNTIGLSGLTEIVEEIIEEMETVQLGDINNDSMVNVLDIILLVGFILETETFTDTEFIAAEYNGDDYLDILDIIGIVNIILTDITIEKIPENSRYSYQCYPNGMETTPALLYNHGGMGESVGGDLLGTCRSLAENGYLTRAEKREETITLEGHLDEVLSALDKLKKHEKADTNRIGVIGFSRGGLLSLQAAIVDDDIGALILLAPATGNGLLYELFDSFNSINSSVLIQISENDNSPDNLLDASYSVYDAMMQNSIDVELIEYPPYDSNENGIIDENDDGHQLFFTVQNPYWNDLIEFIDEKLSD